MFEGWSKKDKAHLVVVVGFVLFAVCLVTLTGCGHKNELHSGTVVSKTYDDPDDWYVPGYYVSGHEDCHMVGVYPHQTESCSYYPGYYVPGYYQHDGPHWYLKITGQNKSGKVVTETHEVDQNVYDRARIGVLWEE